MSTILIIEDEQEIRDNLVDLLEAAEYDTLVATDGADGIEKARRHLPDLILCDVMMPHVDGFDVVENVRNHEALSATPFIFLTAKSTGQDLRRGMTNGADDYLMKPFKANELFAAIESRMERFKRMQAKQKRHLAKLHQSISKVIPHELRTPLVAIEGFTSLLLDDWDDLDDEMAQEMLRDVLGATKRLKHFVERNALFARLISSTDAEDVPDATCDVRSSARPALRKVAANHARTADLKCSLDAGAVALQKDFFQRLIMEVADNAFKFSEPGSPIRVTGTARSNDYVLTVTDAGRGMRAAQLREISAYRQFDRHAHEQQGAGLGLVLSRKICRRAGGTLNIESTPERGTTIQATLPLATSHSEHTADDAEALVQ